MSQFKAAALFCGPTVVLIGLAALIGGRLAWWLAASLSLVTLGVFWQADRFVLAYLEADILEEQAAPGLFALVATLARRHRLTRTPSVCQMAEAAPNALVVARLAGRSHVVVSSGLLASLSSSELAGIIAHQISLLGALESRVMTLAVLYALLLEKTLLARFTPALLAQFAAFHSARFAADFASAHLTGEPAFLIEALKRIDRASARTSCTGRAAIGPLRISDTTTGPPLKERIGRLEALSLRPIASKTMAECGRAPE